MSRGWRSGTKKATDGTTVSAIVVVGRVNVTRIEVEVVTVSRIVLRRRPVVAVATNIVERAIVTIDVATSF